MGVALPPALASVAVIALLAVNAFFLSLRIEPGALRLTSGPENIALGALSVGRVLLAMALLVGTQNA
ncbi:hypothetical protein [Xanthomonas campestris]|uniref:hypothetical protein n=1 Tax=Xanthomonas campestris TaxID=339 RepID=UPI000E32D0AD|nr:hypothetical protein [Xanthomonas campestris]MEA9760088.1 hypothetical protein [Xanthomonas campestris pv. raphani]MEA9843985.1 hypothetical protein [Xanthomonas campestris pv. raphani]MEA9904437.1 hypothetical protein [Xanthomonas campestris pv. raphani]RFF67189.1 hypothetical protein D0A40_11180 [Xanthomonas campestris pv. raphani]